MPLRLMLSDSAHSRDYVLAVIGPIDPSTAMELRRWATNPAPGYRVVLDLSSTSPVSAACLELIADVARQLARHGRSLCVIASDQVAAEAITTVGVQHVLVDRRDENRLAVDSHPLAAAS
jgi:anti-anti-sigma regulatory factor